MSEWDEEKKDISLSGMKLLIFEMAKAQKIAAKLKEEFTEAYAKYEEQREKVISALEVSGLQNFKVPGLGTASLVKRFKVTVPKDTDQKRKLFDYIAETYGADVLDEYRSINYQTLNAFYNQEAETAKAEGRDINIPGLDDPVEDVGLSFRKDKA